MSEELLIQDGVKYMLWTPENEPRDFEPMIKHHITDIFGEDSRYFPKQKLRTLANNNSIPDGFVIDFKNKRWYVVESKLLCDDAVRRISGQIVDYKNAMKNPQTRQQIFKSIYDELNKPEMHVAMYDLIINKNPEIVVLLDDLTGEMGAQFKEKVEGVDLNVKISVFKTFAREGVDPKKEHVHLFEPVLWRDDKLLEVLKECEKEILERLNSGTGDTWVSKLSKPDGYAQFYKENWLKNCGIHYEIEVNDKQIEVNDKHIGLHVECTTTAKSEGKLSMIQEKLSNKFQGLEKKGFKTGIWGKTGRRFSKNISAGPSFKNEAIKELISLIQETSDVVDDVLMAEKRQCILS